MGTTTFSRLIRWIFGRRHRSSRSSKGDKIFARGSTDNKGQILAHILGVESALKERGDLPVNLIFLVEGEEEIGSPNLEAFLKEHSFELACGCGGNLGHRNGRSRDSDLYLWIAGNIMHGNPFARTIGGSSFRNFWRIGGKSCHGVEPDRGKTSR